MIQPHVLHRLLHSAKEPPDNDPIPVRTGSDVGHKLLGIHIY